MRFILVVIIGLCIIVLPAYGQNLGHTTYKNLSYEDKLKLLQGRVPVIRYEIPQVKEEFSITKEGSNFSNVQDDSEETQNTRSSKAITRGGG